MFIQLANAILLEAMWSRPETRDYYLDDRQMYVVEWRETIIDLTNRSH